MNFIEVGLPHTEFVPTKKEFSPRRPIPMSGLSKKYMGLETLSKSEMGSLIDRLSQPKAPTFGQAPENDTTNENKPRRRFTGCKKMNKSDVDSMITRLSSTKPDKTPEARRIQTTEERVRRGVTASYAWQGKVPGRGNQTVSNYHIHYRNMLKRHTETNWQRGTVS